MPPRPSYHITAPQNWLNDPVGAIHYNDHYHLFYQHNPHAVEWGPPHWGHVSSPDLVHWRRHPIALSPTGTGPDADGIWSGCALDTGEGVAAFYTGVTGSHDTGWVQSVCRADSSGSLDRWSRSPANPLIPGPPPGIKLGAHRDPFVYFDKTGWAMLLGAGLNPDSPDAAGAILRYDSPDLVRWTYSGIYYTRTPTRDGPPATHTVWECPQLISIDGHDVLIWSVQDPDLATRPLRYAVYAIGTAHHDRFTPTTLGRLDHGETFYAPATTIDANDRPLVWGWLQDDPDLTPTANPYAGVLSLPRQLHLHNGRLATRPVPEITAAATPVKATSLRLHPNQSWTAPNLNHHSIVHTTIATQGTVDLRLDWHDNPRGTIIRTDLHRGEVTFHDRRGDITNPRDGYTCHLPDADTRIGLSTYIDADTIEAFTDTGMAMSGRLPSTKAPPTLSIKATHSAAAIELRLSEMPSTGLITTPQPPATRPNGVSR